MPTRLFSIYESSLIFLVHPRRLRRLAPWRWWCKVGVAHFAPPSPTGLSRFSGEPGLRGNVSLAPETSGMTHKVFQAGASHPPETPLKKWGGVWIQKKRLSRGLEG